MGKTISAIFTAAAIGAVSAANAAVISLDDFNMAFSPNPLTTSSGTVTSDTAITPGGNMFDRTTTLTVDRNVNGAPSAASVRAHNGSAIFSNDSGVSSILTFSYDVGSTVFEAQTGIADGALRIVEVFADRPRTYTFSLNGVVQDTTERLIDTEFGFANEIFLLFSTDQLTGDDTFSLEIDAGVAGISTGSALDLQVSSLQILIPDVPSQVPAPGALGLIGLGILTLGTRRRGQKPA